MRMQCIQLQHPKPERLRETCESMVLVKLWGEGNKKKGGCQVLTGADAMPLHANPTPTSSTPLTSPTTSSPPMAHERASSTIPKVVSFASRSFTSPFTVFSGLRPTQ